MKRREFLIGAAAAAVAAPMVAQANPNQEWEDVCRDMAQGPTHIGPNIIRYPMPTQVWRELYNRGG